MAIINCPACGKEISDQATSCVHCGEPLGEADAWEEEAEQPEQITCAECGKQVPEGEEVCPNCGCPVKAADGEAAGQEATGDAKAPERKVKGRTILIVIAVAVVAIAAVAIGFAVSAHQSQVKQDQEAAAAQEAAQRAAEEETAAYNQYIDTLEEAMMVMLSGAADAETLGNTTRNVWNSAIFERSADDWDEEIRKYYADDFNDALSNLYADPDTVQMVSDIKANQERAAELYKQLQDPPAGLEGAFATYEDMYDAYTKLTRLAVSPTGSLQSYNEEFREADQDCVEAFEKLQARIPEKK